MFLSILCTEPCHGFAWAFVGHLAMTSSPGSKAQEGSSMRLPSGLLSHLAMQLTGMSDALLTHLWTFQKQLVGHSGKRVLDYVDL